MHYSKPLQHITEEFGNFDLAMEKNLACHPDLPAFVCKRANQTQQATGDLVIIAFYYSLSVGEYTTKTRRNEKTCTRQFQAKDEIFFVKNAQGDLAALPRTASIDEIMSAAAVTLHISNQKNGHAGACVCHEAILGRGRGRGRVPGLSPWKTSSAY